MLAVSGDAEFSPSKTLGELAREQLLQTQWWTLVEQVMQEPFFSKLSTLYHQALKNEQGPKIYPQPHQIFTWARLLEGGPEAVRVVILGQDPYHGAGQAHGLAFSVPPGFRPLPGSLRNIFKEAAPGHRFDDGCLQGWSRQGVLLLNTTLTVRAGQAGSHASWPWSEFTQKIVQGVLCAPGPRVFMLWGRHAQKCLEGVLQRHPAESTRHLILRAAHPSPLSASRGFLGCGHFSQANAFLCDNNLPTIDWTRTSQ